MLNFAASNFPFAFSVAGGDTAAALAAGCPVIVKGHPGHPLLSVRTAEIVAAALVEAGLPEATLQLVTSQDAGLALVEHPAVRAAAFTGSQRVGQLLAARAAARPDPIPFFGELGSVNPVLVSPEALRERADDLLAGYVASVSGSAGQLCTKPGFLLVPEGTEYDDAVVTAAAQVPEHRLLNPSIADGYERRVGQVLAVDGVRVVHDGGFRRDADGQAWATPTFVAVPLDLLRSAGAALLDEVFGPFSVIVEYPAGAELGLTVAELFPGNLTLTLHLGSGETQGELGEPRRTPGAARGPDPARRLADGRRGHPGDAARRAVAGHDYRRDVGRHGGDRPLPARGRLPGRPAGAAAPAAARRQPVGRALDRRRARRVVGLVTGPADQQPGPTALSCGASPRRNARR